jgi:hypothetical protein
MPPDPPAQRAAARLLLTRLLPDYPSLKAFCARHFPAVAAVDEADAATAGALADRLLSSATVAEVRYRLALEHPAAVARHTDYALALTPPGPPPLRRLPWPRDPHFVGRTAQLGALRGLLTRHAQVAICGPAGVGKTALARALAELLLDCYPLVYGLTASSAATLRQGLGELAQRLAALGWIAAATDAEAGLAAVRALLNQRADWLLIVDDVGDDEAVRELLTPAIAAGHLVMTRRGPPPPGWAALALDPLAEDEALQLLAQRSDRHQLLPGERAAVRQLVRALGGWPSALCTVADALRQRGGTWTAALAELAAGSAGGAG